MKFHEKWILKALSLVGEVIQQPGHEAGHPLPITSEVKYEWSCTSSPPVHPHGMYCTGMTLPSVRMDVLFSGCTKLFNVCITCNIFCLHTTMYQHSDIIYT